MPETTSSDADSEPTAKDELMAATGRALTRHGLSDLTTQKIANEWGKSQSLLHYYFETKEELLVSFVESIRAESRRAYDEHAEDPPLDRIRWFLNRHLSSDPDAEHRSRGDALFELHSRAAQEEAYREKLDAHEEDVREFVETAIRDGIEDGTFRPVDPAELALLVVSMHDGVALRTQTLGRDDDVSTAQRGIERYVLSELLQGDDSLDGEAVDANERGEESGANERDGGPDTDGRKETRDTNGAERE
jgi:AcrR family transcriptional regulator